MSRRKEIALVAAGALAGIAASGPAAQAAASLMANPSSQTFYVNEEKVILEAYEINGSNYVKLRDIGQAAGFSVTYDAAANSVIIRPNQPCTEEVNTAKLTNGASITEENVLELLRQIQRDWPQDTVWGTRDTPGTHKNDIPSTEARRITGNYPVNSTYGCGGYAAMVSSMVFGDTEKPRPKQEGLTPIRPRDNIILVNNATSEIWHVEIALESPNENHAFQYTDGNHGGHVRWPDPSNPYGGENLDCYQGEKARYRIEAWTRYPESVPYTGSSANAWYQ